MVIRPPKESTQEGSLPIRYLRSGKKKELTLRHLVPGHLQEPVSYPSSFGGVYQPKEEDMGTVNFFWKKKRTEGNCIRAAISLWILIRSRREYSLGLVRFSNQPQIVCGLVGANILCLASFHSNLY